MIYRYFIKFPGTREPFAIEVRDAKEFILKLEELMGRYGKPIEWLIQD